MVGSDLAGSGGLIWAILILIIIFPNTDANFIGLLVEPFYRYNNFKSYVKHFFTFCYFDFKPAELVLPVQVKKTVDSDCFQRMVGT